MKQPELGKKILELRKQKGFTQEELVEKCNINVRTIQRIEAGDVTPRSFTVKTILEALGVDGANFFKSNEATFSSREKTILNTSWITAILFTIITVVSMILEGFYFNNQHDSGELFFRSISGTFTLITLFFFLRGYKALGDRFGINSLVSGTYVYFILEIIAVSIVISLTVFDFEEDVVEILSGIVLILTLGISELILGLGIRKLKDQLGSFAQTVGILKIVNGALLLTIILSPIAVFLSIPILIAEIIFLYNTTQKVEGENYS